MSEEVKRLTPTGETLRELFLKSGNLCAFPGCSQLMMNPEGDFIGQICHIEAAEVGGQRFNALMSNEDRRNVKNLMLMCYPHHVVTNDVATYTVEKLREMKVNHEARFTDVGQRIEKAIVDEGSRNQIRGGQTLKRMHDVLGWKVSDDNLKESVEEFNSFVKALVKVPRPARQVLLSLVERAERENFGRKYKVMHKEIAEACVLPSQELAEYVGMLEKYGYAYGEYDDETRTDFIHMRTSENGWYFWEDLKKFSEKTNLSLFDFVVNLNFSSLDQ